MSVWAAMNSSQCALLRNASFESLWTIFNELRRTPKSLAASLLLATTCKSCNAREKAWAVLLLPTLCQQILKQHYFQLPSDKLAQIFPDCCELYIWVQVCRQHPILHLSVIQTVNPNALDQSSKDCCHALALCRIFKSFKSKPEQKCHFPTYCYIASRR